jgi:hypothetical protein
VLAHTGPVVAAPADLVCGTLHDGEDLIGGDGWGEDFLGAMVPGFSGSHWQIIGVTSGVTQILGSDDMNGKGNVPVMRAGQLAVLRVAVEARRSVNPGNWDSLVAFTAAMDRCLESFRRDGELCTDEAVERVYDAVFRCSQLRP